MTELLPIIFQKGVDQSIDPRVAPIEVHSVAENVRWRKDGRPAKRYGSVLVDMTGFEPGTYAAMQVNAIASWNKIPVLAIGSAVRAQTPLGWTNLNMGDRELAHFGPGKHDVVARYESAAFSCQTAGFHKTAFRTILLYAWSGGGATSYMVREFDGGGAIIRPATALDLGATEPRVISTDDYLYVLVKVGTNLKAWVFDPNTCAFINTISVGTLSAAGDHYDGWGRGSEFLVSYQSAAADITTKLFSATSAPVLQQTRVSAVLPASGCRMSVTGTATSQVVVAILDNSSRQIRVDFFPNNMAAGSLGYLTIDTDLNNDAQPGVVMRSNTVADVTWGGLVAATETTYMRVRNCAASGPVSATRTHYGVAPASKPFVGHAYAPLAEIDATYVWVETSNDSTKWDSQRGYLLVKFDSSSLTALTVHLSVPNMPSSPTSRLNLGDVLNMGTGRGFLTPLLQALRYGNGLPASYGVDAITFRSIFEFPRTAARDHVTAGRALQFCGGQLREFIGELSQTGFNNIPVIQGFTSSGVGSLSGSYLYKVVYEYIDDQGRRHRSAPSDPFPLTVGGVATISLVMKPLVADSHFPRDAGGVVVSGVVFHVYRTLANQGTYHRVTPNAGGPTASVPGTASVTFADSMTDAAALLQEILYTDGGVLPNTLPPPAEFMTLCAGRVWLGGQLDRSVVTASKLLVDGEPTQFSDDPIFSPFLPEECTGLASIDGTVIAFAREKIYLISGDGPNDQGIGEFRPPVELPTDVGCIDWRSVVETSIGVFFQSLRGIFLLPRGFGTPVFIGAPIEATLAQFPIVHGSIVVVEKSGTSPVGVEPVLGEVTARFVVGTDEFCTESRIITYDLRTGGWSVDRQGAPVYQFTFPGTWLDRFVVALGGGFPGPFRILHAETVGSYVDPTSTDASGFIRSTLASGDVRPFGVAGYGGFDRVVAVGEYRASCFVTISVSVDGAAPDTFTFPVSSPDEPDGSVYLDVTPKTRIGASIRVSVTDSESSFGPNEGFLLQALFIEHTAIGRTKRLAEARKG